jgi:hypothetical protein
MTAVDTPSGGVTSRDAALKSRVHQRLVGEGTSPEPTSPAAVRARLRELLRDEEPLLVAAHFERLVAELVDEVAGLGPLEPLLGKEIGRGQMSPDAAGTQICAIPLHRAGAVLRYVPLS